jgi:hypothetical protein
MSLIKKRIGALELGQVSQVELTKIVTSGNIFHKKTRQVVEKIIRPVPEREE